MRYRMDVISAPLGGLAVRQRWVNGSSQFVGALNGRECVLSPTFEGAVQALLRRACYAAAH
jgi:hypothetical protein